MHACSCSRADCSKFMNITAGMFLKFILGSPVSIVYKYENLDITGNVRSDSVIYDLLPLRAGKRGRPAFQKKKLFIHNDFTLSEKNRELSHGCAFCSYKHFW